MGFARAFDTVHVRKFPRLRSSSLGSSTGGGKSSPNISGRFATAIWARDFVHYSTLASCVARSAWTAREERSHTFTAALLVIAVLLV